MFVTFDGRRLGTLTVGGCVDGRTAEQAASVIADGEPRRIEVVLGEDEPDFGMSCAGIVHVFVEKVDQPHLHAFEQIRSLIEAGRQAILVTPLSPGLEIAATTPDELARLIEDAPTEIGEDDCLLLPSADRRPELFLQSFSPPRLLVVIGTGPVAEPLVRMARQIGYRTCVVDGNEIDGFVDANVRRTGIPSEVCKELDLDARSAVVIASHDYKNEVPVLREVLSRNVGFVGFLASSRRGEAVLDFLETTGTPPDRLADVRVPVGLDIGAMTPSEIAVSILSEMLAVRSGRSGRPLKLDRDPDLTARYSI